MIDDLSLSDAIAAAESYGTFDENGDYFIPDESLFSDVRQY